MEGFGYPDRRHLLPPEIPLARGGHRHPVLLSAQLRCFTRAARIMEAWGSWRILAPAKPDGPHPVLASRDPEFIGLVMPSLHMTGRKVRSLFTTSDWVRAA